MQKKELLPPSSSVVAGRVERTVYAFCLAAPWKRPWLKPWIKRVLRGVDTHEVRVLRVRKQGPAGGTVGLLALLDALQRDAVHALGVLPAGAKMFRLTDEQRSDVAELLAWLREEHGMSLPAHYSPPAAAAPWSSEDDHGIALVLRELLLNDDFKETLEDLLTDHRDAPSRHEHLRRLLESILADPLLRGHEAWHAVVGETFVSMVHDALHRVAECDRIETEIREYWGPYSRF